jgi:hypothetical protein
MSSEDSRCNVHLADVDGHEEPFNYCSIHHLDYYVDFKPEDRPTWEKYTDDCIRALALKAQALRKQAKELVRQLSQVQDRVDGLSICLPGIVNDTAFPYFEKEVNLPELYHKVLRGLGYNNRSLAVQIDELHMSVDIHQDSYMDLRDALVCHSGLTAYGAQEHIKRRVMAFGLATGHTHEQATCSPPPSSSPISTPPRVSPSTSPLSKNRRNPSNFGSTSITETVDEPLFNSSARDHLQAFLQRARKNRQEHADDVTEESFTPRSPTSSEPTTARDLGARPRNNHTIQPLSLPPVPFRTASSSYSSTIDTLSAADLRWPQELLPNSVFSQDFLPEVVDAHQALDSTNIWTPTTSSPIAPSTTPPDGARANRIEMEDQTQKDNEVLFSRLNLVAEEENWN